MLNPFNEVVRDESLNLVKTKIQRGEEQPTEQTRRIQQLSDQRVYLTWKAPIKTRS